MPQADVTGITEKRPLLMYTMTDHITSVPTHSQPVLSSESTKLQAIRLAR